MSGLKQRQCAGTAATPLAWALLASLAAHGALLGWSTPQRLPASALSRLEVRLESGVASSAPSAQVRLAEAWAAEPGEGRQAQALAVPRSGQQRVAAPASRPSARTPGPEGQPHRPSNFASEPAPSAADQALGAALPPAVGGAGSTGSRIVGPSGVLQTGAAAVPLDSAGGRLTLPQAVRVVYRQVGGSGQRELLWRLDGGHYALQWTERRADGGFTARASARGVLSYAGLLPLSYRELRPGQEAREWRFDWSAGVVQRNGADSAREEPVLAGDQDPLSLLMQLAVMHQVLAEAPRRAGVLLAVAGVGEVSARHSLARDAPGRARYEFDTHAAGLGIVAVELAAEHAFLPVQLEEIDGARRTVWQLAALENLDAD